MLQQRSRLAALGLAVSKINHDLRNVLATAQLISDRLGTVKDPTVERVTPRLLASLDRAIRLCTDTLRYGQVREPAPERREVALAPIVSGLAEDLGLHGPDGIGLRLEISEGLTVDADPDQLYRILSNLVVNAKQVLEAQQKRNGWWISIAAKRHVDSVEIRIADNGPGLPERARAHLFEAFQGSARPGGTGLGLAIVDELVRAHGGEIRLLEGPGTIFQVTLPDRGRVV